MLMECSNCGGKGYLIIKNTNDRYFRLHPSLDSKSLRWIRVVCPECKGRGFEDKSPFKTTA